MLRHMRTTVRLDDGLLGRARHEAARLDDSAALLDKMDGAG